MIPDTVISKLSNHLYVMASKDELTEFWAESFGLAADSYRVIFADEIRREYGLCTLYKDIEAEIVEHSISVLLIDLSAPIYDPFVLRELKQKYNLMVVLVVGDDEFKFSWISSSYATLADLVLSTDYVSIDRYRQSGVNAHFFPYPVYIPDELPTRTEEGLGYGVSIVGATKKKGESESRSELIQFLTNKIDISLFLNYGTSDPRYLSRDDMYSVFHNSVINLNFAGICSYTKPDDPLFKRIRGMKLRPFEIAAAGGFCMSEFSISLSKSFEDEVDIIFFRNRGELLEKITYFLEHKDEAKRIAKNAAQKIREQYSPEAVAKKLATRIQQSQQHIGIDLYGTPHIVQASRWLASSYLVFALSNSVNLALKGKLGSCFHDSWSCTRFLKSFLDDAGALATLKVTLLSLYQLGKVALGKVQSVVSSAA